MVYRYALVAPEGFEIVSRTKGYRRVVRRERFIEHYNQRCASLPGMDGAQDSDESESPTVLVPALLAVNREIHAEASALLYKQPFRFENTSALYYFLATAGPSNRAMLEDISIHGWGHTKAHKALNHPAFTMLGDTPNLKRLSMDCDMGWHDTPKRVAQRLFRSAHVWFEAVGTATGRKDAGIKIIDVADSNLICAQCRDLARNRETFMDEIKILLMRTR